MEKSKERFLLNAIQAASYKSKLTTGLTGVLKAATEHHSRLLLLEENYEYPEISAGTEEMIYTAKGLNNRFSYLKNTVDEIIEKILEDGGCVEFESKKIMEQYDHIALIINSKKNNLYENNYPGD